MSIKIGSNISSLSAQRLLASSSRNLESVFDRLSSGQRINRSSDDAAGLAIADSLNAGSRVFTRGVLNLNDGISVLAIADQTVGQLGGIATRLIELAEQSANGSYSSKQRSALDAEAQALKAEYFRVASSTKFNGTNLFDGSMQGLRLQAGYGVDGSLFSSLGGFLGSGTATLSGTYAAETGSANDIVSIDIDGDGNLDLVTVGTSDAVAAGYFTVRIGDGNGSYGTSVSYATGGTSGAAIALGDVNGDGAMDLVAAGAGGGGYASIHLGDGRGAFTATVTYATESSSSTGVKLADMNGDGILDLTTTGSVGGNEGVTIRLGRGDGTFGASSQVSSSNTQATDIFIADLNNDGRNDVITTDFGGRASVRLGNGDGTLGTRVDYTQETLSSYALAIGDFNNDGNLDLVSAGAGAGAGRATVRLGLGNGSFGNAISYNTGGNEARAITLGDLNGDGFLDIVTGGQGSSDGHISILLGAGNGTFGSASSVMVLQTGGTDRVLGVALTDANSDGVIDILAAGLTNTSDGAAGILRGSTRDGISPLIDFSLKTLADSRQALSQFKLLSTRLATQRGTIGAFQSRLSVASATLTSQSDQYRAAESRIRDTDIASDSGELARLQILQSAGASVLSQANLQPQIALRLLVG